MKTLLCAIAFLAAPLMAQHTDFLTADEVDQIKEAQDPNARLALYAKFARERIDLVKNLLAKDKPGRAVMIHDALDDYAHIIDAIDDVTDDAIERKIDIGLSMKKVAEAEKSMLPLLEKISENPPKDVERYEFALRTALETTRDSMQSASGDIAEREKAVKEKDAREKAEIRANMTPTEKEGKDAQDKKAAEEEQKKDQRKPPTLYRPGEKKDGGGGN